MKYAYVYTIGLSLFFLSSCGKQPVKQERIKPLTTQSADFSQTNNNITVSVKKMIPQDSRKTFSGVNLLAKGVQPLQVSVHNMTQDAVTITQDNLGLPLINATQCQELFKQANISAGGVIGLIGIGIAVGAVGFLVGVYILGSVVLLGTLPHAFSYVGLGIMCVSPTLPIVVPVIGVTAKTYDQSLNANALQITQTENFIEQLTIESHTTKDFLLLVKKEDYKDQFSMTMQQPNNKTIFDVALPEHKKKRLSV